MPHVEHDRHAGGDHVGERRRAAVVVDMRHVDAGADLQHLAGQMPDAARTGRGEVERLAPRLRLVDQLRNGARRECLVRHQGDRLRGDHADAGELAERIVGQLLVDRRIDQQRVGADQHRVAVRQRLGDRCGRHDGAGAWAVLHDHRVPAPARREQLRQDARHHVGRAARRERHDQTERCAGKGRLPLRLAACECEHHDEQRSRSPHRRLPIASCHASPRSPPALRLRCWAPSRAPPRRPESRPVPPSARGRCVAPRRRDPQPARGDGLSHRE